MEAASVHSGWLHTPSKNAKGKNWKKRWCVLTKGAQLQILKKKTSSTPKDMLDMQGATVMPFPEDYHVRNSASAANKGKNFFGTRCKNSALVRVFQAPGAKERSAWLEAIESCGATLGAEAEHRVNPLSLKEAFLEVTVWKDGKKKNPKKRFFCLMNNLLTYYKKKTDKSPCSSGYIELTRNTVVNDGGNCTFQLSNGGSQTYDIVCPSNAVRDEWLELVKFACNKHVEPLSSDSEDTSLPPSRRSSTSSSGMILKVPRTRTGHSHSRNSSLPWTNGVVINSSANSSLSPSPLLEGLRTPRQSMAGGRRTPSGGAGSNNMHEAMSRLSLLQEEQQQAEKRASSKRRGSRTPKGARTPRGSPKAKKKSKTPRKPPPSIPNSDAGDDSSDSSAVDLLGSHSADEDDDSRHSSDVPASITTPADDEQWLQAMRHALRLKKGSVSDFRAAVEAFCTSAEAKAGCGSPVSTTSMLSPLTPSRSTRTRAGPLSPTSSKGGNGSTSMKPSQGKSKRKKRWNTLKKKVGLRKNRSKGVNLSDGGSKGNSMLHVHILEARGLPPVDDKASAEPYCKLYIVHPSKPDDKRCKRRTRPIKGGSVSPVWDETMTLTYDTWEDLLVVDVFDDGKSKAGRVMIPIEQLEQEESVSAWFHLQDDKGLLRGGSVALTLFADPDFVPEGERNQTTFQRARLDALDAMSTASPHLLQGMPGLNAGWTEEEKVRVFCGTLNAGNAPPPDDLSPWIPTGEYDVYAIGAQECNYTPRVNYSSCKDDWMGALVRHLGQHYTLIRYHSLWEMRLAVFVANHLVTAVNNVWADDEATGLGNVLGNKGGVVVGLNLHHTSLCFVNSHLAAHQGKEVERNQDYSNIVKGVHPSTASGADILNQFHHVFWMGDLNYRLDFKDQGDDNSPGAALFATICGMIHSDRLMPLATHDQLMHEREERRAFVGFNEGDISAFRPTFKVARGQQLQYLAQRSPAWCDRVLWRSIPGFDVQQVMYGSAEGMLSSDHKPVSAGFELSAALMPPAVDRQRGGCKMSLWMIKLTLLKPDQAKEVKLRIGAAFLPGPVYSPSAKKNASDVFEWEEATSEPATMSVNNHMRLRQMWINVSALSGSSNLGTACLSLRKACRIEAQSEVAYEFTESLTRDGLETATLEGVLLLRWPEKQSAKLGGRPRAP